MYISNIAKLQIYQMKNHLLKNPERLYICVPGWSVGWSVGCNAGLTLMLLWPLKMLKLSQESSRKELDHTDDTDYAEDFLRTF